MQGGRAACFVGVQASGVSLARAASARVCGRGFGSECVAASTSRRSFRNAPVNMGVQVETISPGDGKTFPQKGQKVSVHYVGTLTTGEKFDSSRDRGDKFQFNIGLGQVIKGWDEGVAQMSVGQRAKLTCTPDFAYGDRGFPPVIPPKSTLIFDVELFGVN